MPQALAGRYLEVPEDYQQVVALARQVAGGETDPRALAQRFEYFLRAGGEYSYTLQQPDTEGKDPLHVFLFDAKAGHCEYFSTAMAIMLRSVGVPARNVTGFVGADYNPYGEYYAVRNGNAHSWVEVFADGRWWTFDPTPASAQAFAAPSGFAVKMRQMLDAMRVRWAEYVVEFNIRDQAQTRSAGWRPGTARSAEAAEGSVSGTERRSRGRGPREHPIPARLALVRRHDGGVRSGSALREVAAKEEATEPRGPAARRRSGSRGSALSISRGPPSARRSSSPLRRHAVRARGAIAPEWFPRGCTRFGKSRTPIWPLALAGIRFRSRSFTVSDSSRATCGREKAVDLLREEPAGRHAGGCEHQHANENQRDLRASAGLRRRGLGRARRGPWPSL